MAKKIISRAVMIGMLLARIIHGFLKSAEKLLWIAKHLQSEYQMLNFVQAATTDRRDL